MRHKFPKLTDSQVALTRADAFTGHVLDEELNLSISESQIIYSIFDSYSEAKDYIVAVVHKRKTIEAVILDKNEKLLYYFNPFDEHKS